MSEVMTSESIVEAEWLLKGYWSKPRFAFTAEKNWSDVDVLAYHPEKKHLVISESKVQGTKNRVFAYTKHTQKKYGNILEYDDNKYLSFLCHLEKLCTNGIIFNDFKGMVKSLTVQLVCNYVVTSEIRSEVDHSLQEEMKKYASLATKVEFQLDSTLDVVARIIKAERDSGQGRRYGYPVLDIAREINRYFYPAVSDAGRKEEDKQRVKNEAIAKFLEALGINSQENTR